MFSFTTDQCKQTGWQKDFWKFSPGFSNFFQVLKNTHFWSIFISLRLKTVLVSIKTLKKYCKTTLNMFSNTKKFLMMTKKFIYRIDFLCQSKILPLSK